MNFTGQVWEVALFVIFALFTADGVASIVSDCRSWDDERFQTPEFLEDVKDEK